MKTDPLLAVLGWYKRPDDIPVLQLDDGFFTMGQLRCEVAKLLACLERRNILLYTEDPRRFLIGFIAGLVSGASVTLPGFIGWTEDGTDDRPMALGDGSHPRFRDIDDLLHDDVTHSVSMDLPETSATVRFLTSGSTGTPQTIFKTSGQLAAEVTVLHRLWGDPFSESVASTTVNHQHLYGLLFAVLLPLASGGRLARGKIEHPDALFDSASGNSVLVSSPAFLARISRIDDCASHGFRMITSSGGPLPEEAARHCEGFFKVPVWEIFGSTETGGIAYRRLAVSSRWSVFSGIEVSVSERGRLVIQSDYLESRDPYETQDLAEILDEPGESRRFRLLGRVDSVVKIEEKRVSLADLELAAGHIQGVEQARFIPLKGRRQSLGGVVLASSSVMDDVLRGQSREHGERLRRELLGQFPALVVPRRWRFLEKLPFNDMGKISKDDLDTLFRPKLRDLDYDILSLDKRGGRLEVAFSFPEGHRVFDGHFPMQSVLPGIAQVDFVAKMARLYLDIGDVATAAPRLKFSSLVAPDERLKLSVERRDEDGNLRYHITRISDDAVTSSGRFRMMRTP